MQLQKFIDDGEFALSRGAFDTAESSFNRACEAARSSKDLAMAAQALRGLALVFEWRKDYQRMASSASEASNYDLEFWGPSSLQVAVDAEIAGRAHLYIGSLEIAEQYLTQSLDLKSQYYGADHDEALSVRRSVLIHALATQRSDIAREQHTVLLPRYRTVSGGRDWDVYLGLDVTVQSWMQRGQQPDAQALLLFACHLLAADFPLAADEARVLERLRLRLFPSVQPQSPGFAAQGSDHVQMPQLKSASAVSTSKGGITDNIKAVAQSYRVRQEIPYFLDDLVSHVQNGMYWQSAIAAIAKSPCSSYPIFGGHLRSAVEQLVSQQKSLTVSLREIGMGYDIQELESLAALLEMSQRTGGGIAPALKANSEAIKAQLCSKEKAMEGLMKAFKWF